MPKNIPAQARKRLKLDGAVSFVIGNWVPQPDTVGDPINVFVPSITGLPNAKAVAEALKTLPAGEYIVLRYKATKVSVSQRTTVEITELA